MERFLSGIKISTSTSLLTPKPLQSGQNPKGALKENNLGSTFGTENPHIGQVCLSERILSPSSVKITLAGDRGERSATFEAIPLGDYNSFASWKLFRQYVAAAYKKSLTHKMSAEDAAMATGSSNESDDEAPF